MRFVSPELEKIDCRKERVLGRRLHLRPGSNPSDSTTERQATKKERIW
jgi:hypothetical protein